MKKYKGEVITIISTSISIIVFLTSHALKYYESKNIYKKENKENNVIVFTKDADYINKLKNDSLLIYNLKIKYCNTEEDRQKNTDLCDSLIPINNTFEIK
jgi:hypothetical protein